MEDRRSGRILCIGAVMVDSVCHVPRLPERGEGVVVLRRESHLGGCAFNSASIARQLGADPILFAPVGQGVFADFAKAELARRGIDPFCVDTDLDCGNCLCLVEPDGERTMVTSPGIERCFDVTWFDALDLSGCRMALASGYEIEGVGGDAIIGFLEAHPRIELYYAPGPRIMGVSESKMERIRALKPVWHLNDLEAVRYAVGRLEMSGSGGPENLVEKAGSVIAADCDNVVVVTMGARGSSAFFPDGTSVFVPVDAIAPVDTVGAGDAHLGALCAARSEGLDWEASLEQANRAASAICMVHGSTLTDDQFEAFGLGR